MVTCTLTILDDDHGEYEDDFIHKRHEGRHVTGPLGGSNLIRDTLRLLDRWVRTYDHCRRDELTILGRYLYAVAFGGEDSGAAPLKRAFEETYDAFSHRNEPLRLRLVLREQARELGALPWEFLYMPRPDGGFFLAGERTKLLLTRFIPNTDPTPEWSDVDPRLKILLVISQPRAPGLGHVAADDLIKQVMELESDQIALRQLESPTRLELRDEIIRLSPHIIHFIGHGRTGQIALRQPQTILLEQQADLELRRNRGEDVPEIDEADWADSRSVCTLLCQGLDNEPGPGRLVFLHACHGATPAISADSLGVFNSVARALAETERITAVVAMQFQISNDDAQRFARKFYLHLRDGNQVDEAVSLARRELGEISTRGRQAWDDRSFGTPVIYLRSADPLFRRHGISRGRVDRGVPAAEPLVKEGCPNPLCLGYVYRDRPPCRACGADFVPCPMGECDGLVVNAPGSKCNMCDFEVRSGQLRKISEQADTEQSGRGRRDTADFGGQPSGGLKVAREEYLRGPGLEWERR